MNRVRQTTQVTGHVCDLVRDGDRVFCWFQRSDLAKVKQYSRCYFFSDGNKIDTNLYPEQVFVPENLIILKSREGGENQLHFGIGSHLVFELNT